MILFYFIGSTDSSRQSQRFNQSNNSFDNRSSYNNQSCHSTDHNPYNSSSNMDNENWDDALEENGSKTDTFVNNNKQSSYGNSYNNQSQSSYNDRTSYQNQSRCSYNSSSNMDSQNWDDAPEKNASKTDTFVNKNKQSSYGNSYNNQSHSSYTDQTSYPNKSQCSYNTVEEENWDDPPSTQQPISSEPLSSNMNSYGFGGRGRGIGRGRKNDTSYENSNSGNHQTGSEFGRGCSFDNSNRGFGRGQRNLQDRKTNSFGFNNEHRFGNSRDNFGSRNQCVADRDDSGGKPREESRWNSLNKDDSTIIEIPLHGVAKVIGNVICLI